MTNKECIILDRIKDLQLVDITKDEALEVLKNASFNDIADELWDYYCIVRDIKSILMKG